MIDFVIEKAIDAALEASGLKDKVARNERVILLKKKYKLDDVESLVSF